MTVFFNVNLLRQVSTQLDASNTVYIVLRVSMCKGKWDRISIEVALKARH